MVDVRATAIAAALVITGCEKTAPKDPRFDGPMPVTFGDCAGSNVTWVSGPRPLPFTPEQLAVIAAAPAPSAGSAAITPPPTPATEPGHTADQVRNAGILGVLKPVEGGAFAQLTGSGDLTTGVDISNLYGLGEPSGEINGGLAGVGMTPTGGGLGFGTIGIGNLGTIGHGSGTGYGIGRRGRAMSVPHVSIGQANANGPLDKEIIRRYIKRNIQKIEYCYEKQLLQQPNLAGTVVAQFVISPSGAVASATATGLDPTVASCVAAVIKNIEFPKPTDGAIVRVSYPFTFKPAGDDTSPRSHVAAPVAATVPPPVVDQGSAAPAAPVEPPHDTAAPKPARELFRSDPGGAGTYNPGAANPLSARSAELTECFRKNPVHYGVAVIELGYDAAGAVFNSSVYGIDHAHTRACLLASLKQIKPAPAGTTAQRCSIAFGEMPVSALPSIDVTDGSIKVDGLAVREEMKRPGHEAAIAALDTLLTSKLEKATAATAPVVAIHGPIVVRPQDTTPMKLLYEVLHTVLSAGDDFVLATRRGTELRLLRPMPLPVVPVPFGTGARWNPMKGRGNGMTATDEDVALSLLVTKDRVWVGISRLNEFQAVERDAAFAQKIDEVLKAKKSSSFFVDREDIEIGGEDDTTYGDLVMVIDAAAKAGFAKWQLAEPRHLAARPTQ